MWPCASGSLLLPLSPCVLVVSAFAWVSLKYVSPDWLILRKGKWVVKVRRSVRKSRHHSSILFFVLHLRVHEHLEMPPFIWRKANEDLGTIRTARLKWTLHGHVHSKLHTLLCTCSLCKPGYFVLYFFYFVQQYWMFVQWGALSRVTETDLWLRPSSAALSIRENSPGLIF